jgi:long-chain acyl-CoA synthetase
MPTSIVLPAVGSLSALSASDEVAASAPASLRDGDVRRVLKDLVRAELRAASGREIDERVAATWDEADALNAPAIDLDSLEIIGSAARVTQFFHLHEAPGDESLLETPTLSRWTGIVVRARRARPALAYTFMTSGSTGEPLACAHGAADLWQEVDSIAGIVGPISRVVSLVPAHHLFGFIFSALLPSALHAEVVDARALSPSAIGEALDERTLLVGVPANLAYVASSVRELRGAKVAVSTGALAPAVASALAERGWGGMFEFYGSSETSGVAWRRALDDPFTLHPFWRAEASGAGSDESDDHAGGGLGAGEARVSALVRTGPDGCERAPVAPPDRLVIARDGGVRLLGRVDAVLKVGGVRVVASHVERVIAGHAMFGGGGDLGASTTGAPTTGVSARVAVRLMTQSEGTRLKAFVVPLGDEWRDPAARQKLSAELDAWCAGRLAPAERPRSWTFGEALPVNAMGKRADWPINPGRWDASATCS